MQHPADVDASSPLVPSHSSISSSSSFSSTLLKSSPASLLIVTRYGPLFCRSECRRRRRYSEARWDHGEHLMTHSHVTLSQIGNNRLLFTSESVFGIAIKKPTDSAEINLWQFHIDTASTGTRASSLPCAPRRVKSRAAVGPCLLLPIAGGPSSLPSSLAPFLPSFPFPSGDKLILGPPPSPPISLSPLAHREK